MMCAILTGLPAMVENWQCCIQEEVCWEFQRRILIQKRIPVSGSPHCEKEWQQMEMTLVTGDSSDLPVDGLDCWKLLPQQVLQRLGLSAIDRWGDAVIHTMDDERIIFPGWPEFLKSMTVHILSRAAIPKIRESFIISRKNARSAWRGKASSVEDGR